MRIKPLFNYQGGKYNLAKRIYQLFCEHRCYVEPFSGAANLLLYKPPAKTEVINDINADIVNLFRVAKHHRRELVIVNYNLPKRIPK
jgi:DNA adenine methylase